MRPEMDYTMLISCRLLIPATNMLVVTRLIPGDIRGIRPDLTNIVSQDHERLLTIDAGGTVLC